MHFELIVIGKTKESYLAEGIHDFLGRLKRHCLLDYRELKEKKASGGGKKKQHESEQLLAACVKGSFKVLLDSKGEMLTSEALAAQIDAWEMRGEKTISLLIGGPDGVDDALRQNVDMLLSLSTMTLTHEMARLVLLEQLYRAYSIKLGTGYHK